MKNLKIESLNKGHVDVDELMLHACFQILKNFIENECDKEIAKDIMDNKKIEISVDSSEYDICKKDIQELYNWWLQRCNKEEFDDEDIKEDESMLIKLIKYRNWLWT
jgi:hypothetical protein